MKKIILLCVSAMFFIGCSNNKINNASQNTTSTGVVNKTEKLVSPEKKDIIPEKELNAFQKSVIKIAFKKGDSMCNSFGDVKLCKKLLNKEKQNYSKGNCDELLVMKQECLNKKYLDNLECDKIVDDENIKSKCNFQKKYDKAIKNKDKTFCTKLPITLRKECFEKMK